MWVGRAERAPFPAAHYVRLASRSISELTARRATSKGGAAPRKLRVLSSYLLSYRLPLTAAAKGASQATTALSRQVFGFSEHTVAGCVRYAAPMFLNEPIEYCAPLGEPLERPDLIGAHRTAVALHVCREDNY
jgi:hypothetical protein